MNEKETRGNFPPHKELEEAAVQMALEGRWQEAEQLNREILEQNPANVEALNRLGKALLELGRYEESYTIYGQSLDVDPYNRIARKNRERLAVLLSSPSRTKARETERERILPDLFISESELMLQLSIAIYSFGLFSLGKGLGDFPLTAPFYIKELLSNTLQCISLEMFTLISYTVSTDYITFDERLVVHHEVLNISLEHLG